MSYGRRIKEHIGLQSRIIWSIFLILVLLYLIDFQTEGN